MTHTTRVAVARTGVGSFAVEDAELPNVGQHDVLVDVHWSGICRSQLNQIDEAAEAPHGRAARALGHEAVGVVRETGRCVRSVRLGQHVLVTWIPSAARAAGRALAPTILRLADGAVASAPDVYTWATSAVVDEVYVYGLDRRPSPAVAIVGCAVPTGAGAVLHSPLQPGETVAVIGVGGVGASAVVAARIKGAAEVIALDVDPVKIAYARTLGAGIGIDTTREDPFAVLAGRGITGVDLVIDCVASQQSVDLATELARPGRAGVARGGTVMLVGVARSSITIDARAIQLQQKAIWGSLGGSSVPDVDFGTYLEWAACGDLDLDRLVSRKYDWDSLADGVADLREGRVLGRALVLVQ